MWLEKYCHKKDMHMSQCMTKGGLWHDVILARKEYYDVIDVCLSISTKPELYKQFKINVTDEEYDFNHVKYGRC